MSERGPWSVKGIDQKARAAARDAARHEGVTLGEYLNKLILEESRDDLPNDMYSRNAGYGAEGTLDQLTRRVEAAEARSTLAITGIDQSVMGLVARLERTEEGQSVIAGHVDGVIDDLRETHAALSDKVRKMEADDSGERNLEALKSLEEALGKLAVHVYEEGGQAQEETDAIKGRVEAGFMDLNERVESVETRIESTLTEAAKRVEKAVEQAELRTEGTTRHLSERFTALETRVSERITALDGLDDRVERAEEDVSGALSSMEGTLVRIQERLNRAETTTDAALKGLEDTFVRLDTKVEALSEEAGPEAARKIRDELEARFQGLADELKLEVLAARNEMARQIAAASTGQDPEAITTLETGLQAVNQRIADGDEHVARAVETMGDQISRISEAFDKRLRSVESHAEAGYGPDVSGDIQALRERVDSRFNEIEAREASAIERVGEEVGKLADRLETRVDENELASARAIEQIGEQVASVAGRLQGRQDEAFGRLSAHVEETRTAQETRLSDALAQMSERFEKVHAEASSSMSPVQKAIASIADRLDMLEGHAHAVSQQDAGREDDVLAAFSAAVTSVSDEEELEDEVIPMAVGSDVFTPGIPQWATPDEPEVAQAEEPEVEPRRGLAFGETTSDPLAELANWAESDDFGAHEARDDDVFDDLPATSAVVTAAAALTDIDVPPLHLDLDGPAIAPPEPAEFEPETVEVDADLAVDPDDPYSGELEEDLDASDYIARARKAALAAATSNTSYDEPSSGRFGGRLPLYAAASVFAITVAGVSGFVLLRGKQSPTDSTPAVASSQPVPSRQAAGGEAVEAAPTGTPVVAPIDTAELETTASTDSTLPPPSVEAAVQAEPDPAPVEPRPLVTAALQPAPEPVSEPEPRQTLASAAFPIIPQTVSLSEAADAGNRIAQYELGLQKLETADYADASDLIEASARQGLPAAQYRLSKLHENGLGVPRDLAAARAWTERAARGGNTRAMHDLAVFHAEGEGGAKSFASAAEWFRKAAEFGVVDSQFNLGVLYQQGLGLTEDSQEALYWFAVAANQGDPAAPQQVQALSLQMPGAIATEIKNRADGWRAATADSVANGNFGASTFTGDARKQVEGVQVALTALGFDLGTPDGVAGPATSQAVRAYQEIAGLPVTGEIDSALVQSLNGRATDA
ncbi:MAG: peptidoglycan-binding protein [Pseudomonadota bacterium]